MDQINSLVKWIRENGTAQDIIDIERSLVQLRQQQWLALYNQLHLNPTPLTLPSANWPNFPSSILPTLIQLSTPSAFVYPSLNWSSQLSAFQIPTSSSQLHLNLFSTPDSAYQSMNRTLDQTSPVAEKKRNISALDESNQTPTSLRKSETTNKPFKCPTCHKRFARKFYMENGHRRTHTNEKPYSCQRCQRQFSDQSNCRAHEQICRSQPSTR